MRAPFLTIVAVLSGSASISPPETEARLARLAAAAAPHVAMLDVVLVVNGRSPFPVSELEAIASRISDLEVYVLADEVEAEAAILAGFEHAVGDAAIVMDLTDFDGALFGPMIERFRSGVEAVLVERRPARPFSAYDCLRHGFYSLYRALTGLDERYLSEQKLLARSVMAYILQFGDGALLMRSLALSSGFRTEILAGPEAHRLPRSFASAAGRAARLLTSGTTRPVRAVSLLGLAGSGVCFLYLLYALAISTLKSGVQPGWTTLSLLCSGFFFLFSVMLALLAEYIVQIHSHTSRRAPYHIAATFRSPALTREARLNIEGAAARR